MRRRGSNQTKREALRIPGEPPDQGKVNHPPMLLHSNFLSRAGKSAACLALLIAAFIIVGSIVWPSPSAVHNRIASRAQPAVNEIPSSSIARFQLLAQNMKRHSDVVIYEEAQFVDALKLHQEEDYLIAVWHQTVGRYLAATYAFEVAQAAQVTQYLAATHQLAVTAAAAAAAQPQDQPDAITTPTSAVTSAPATGNPTGDTVTPFQRAEWDKVSICEESGDWAVDGATYSGGLGFTHANWTQFNTFGFPSDAAYATPDEQIRVAVAFATAYLGGPNAAPDQDGCTGGY